MAKKKKATKKKQPPKDDRAIGRSDMDVLRGWAIQAYTFLYQRMVENGDYPNALRAVDKLHAIARG